MGLLNHFLLAFFVSFSLSIISFMLGVFLLHKKKKVLGEISAIIFVISFFMIFYPFANADITGLVAMPFDDYDDEITVNGSSIVKIKFPLNNSLQKAYVNLKSCNGKITAEAYGYSSFISSDDSVDVMINVKNTTPGIYDCRFSLCKDAFCNKTITSKSVKLRVE